MLISFLGDKTFSGKKLHSINACKIMFHMMKCIMEIYLTKIFGELPFV